MSVPARRSAALAALGLALLAARPAAPGPSPAAPAAAHRRAAHARGPADDAALWRTLLTLLKRHGGSLTPAQMAGAFGIRLRLRHRDRYDFLYHGEGPRGERFSLNLYTATFHFPDDPAFDAPRVDWSVSWPADPAPGRCLRADRVSADLTAAGWTAPFGPWGLEERNAALSAAPTPGPMRWRDPGLPAQSLWHFARRNAAPGALPQGRLAATGDLPGSCVTAVMLSAPAALQPGSQAAARARR